MNSISIFRIFSLACIISMTSCGIFKKGDKVDGMGYQQKLKFQDQYFQAAKEKILGNNIEAIKSFEKALEINPSCHACMYQMANIFYAENQVDQAVYWAERSIAKNPAYNFWYYGQLGQFYNRKGNYLKSAETFLSMTEKEPNKKSNYIEASNQFINAGDLKRSLEVLISFEKQFGLDEEAARKMEGIYGELKKGDKANEVMLRLVIANPDDIRYKGLLAESYMRNGKINEAFGIYTDMLALEPENGYAHFGMADILRRKGEDDQSFYHMTRAFEDKDVSVALKLQVVQSYFPFLRTDSAMRAQCVQLMNAIETSHPQEPNIYIAYSDILYSTGDLFQARTKLIRAIELDGANFNTWQQLIALDSELGNFKMMAGDSKKFLERFPMQPLPYLTNSHANMMLGNYEEAVAIAKEGLEISMLKNDRTQLLITLGTAYYEIKEFAKSDKAHDELLELSPNDDLGLNNYAFFLAERKVRLSDAQTMIEKALSISPANASYLDTYGWVWYQLEDYEKAVIYFNKAMQMDPTDLEILNHLAMSYDKLGKKNEASEVRKRIEEIEKSLDTGI